MEARAFLKQWVHLDTKRKNKLIEKAILNDIALSVTAPMGGEKVKSSGSNSKMADAADACMDMMDEICETVIQLVKSMKEITDTIESLNTSEYKVLHMKYIQRLSYYEIGDACDRDYNWAKNVHRRAIKKVQRILDERQQNEKNKQKEC